MSQNEIISCPVAVARIMVTRVRGLKLKIKRALGLVRVKEGLEFRLKSVRGLGFRAKVWV